MATPLNAIAYLIHASWGDCLTFRKPSYLKLLKPRTPGPAADRGTPIDRVMHWSLGRLTEV